MNFWLVDAFTCQPFRGNPAAVVILKEPLPDQALQDIAAEMNQSETAFILESGGQPHLRWFTPKIEVDLCGHATLAAAHIYLSHFSGQSEVTFSSKFAGPLTVRKEGQRYTLDFPARPGRHASVDEIPAFVLDALSPHRPIAARSARDLMLVYENESIIRSIQPNFSALNVYDRWIIVTSRSKDCDFVSRFFCAGDGIDEDPVTGSAHCTLGPYWAGMLKKNQLAARQISTRGGDLRVELKEDRVLISGEAVTVVEGKIRPFGQ